MKRVLIVRQDGVCPLSGSKMINMAMIIQDVASDLLAKFNNISQPIFFNHAEVAKTKQITAKVKIDSIKDE